MSSKFLKAKAECREAEEEAITGRIYNNLVFKIFASLFFVSLGVLFPLLPQNDPSVVFNIGISMVMLLAGAFFIVEVLETAIEYIKRKSL